MLETTTAPAVYFSIQSGAQVGETAVIDGAKPIFVIGSDPRADLQLDDASVGDSHALVSFKDGDYFIRPRFPHTAVWVDDMLIAQPTRLLPGMRVQIGQISLLFAHGEARPVVMAVPVPVPVKQAAIPHGSAEKHQRVYTSLPAKLAYAAAESGERAIFYPKAASENQNPTAFLIGLTSILGVVGLFFYILFNQSGGLNTANAYEAYGTGVARVITFYADW